MIYFTSDLHFWHKNSIVYTNRPFETVEKMNEKLIEYWNKTVHANDEVYILGDVTMVRPGRATEIISQLKGRKYLLMGNHDYFAREKQFEPAACGIEWVKMYHELILSSVGTRTAMAHTTCMGTCTVRRNIIC